MAESIFTSIVIFSVIVILAIDWIKYAIESERKVVKTNDTGRTQRMA